MDEKDQSAAATTIQKNYRRYLVLKEKILELRNEQRTEYRSFLIGNDPKMDKLSFASYSRSANFVLVGTSLFRSVEIACHLAASNDVFGKIILVDKSRNAVNAWKKIKAFFESNTLNDPEEFVNDEENGWLTFILNELNDEILIGNQAFQYFNDFFKKNSLDFIKKLVIGSSIISQDWADLATFKKIKRKYADRAIIAYPSNIIPYVSNPDQQIKILKCIEVLNPLLCIHSNYDPVQKKPTLNYFTEDFNELPTILELDLDESKCSSPKRTRI